MAPPTSSDHKDEILQILSDLERKEKIFETYKVASGAEYRFQTKAIVEFIEFEMRKVIRVDLDRIYEVDKVMCELLCNVFFGRQLCLCREVLSDNSNSISSSSERFYDRDTWPECQFHLYSGVLLMYACTVMIKLFEGVHDQYMIKRYTDNRKYFEQKTLNLLNEIFRQDAKLARSSLEIDYEIIFRDDVNSSSKLRYQSQPSNAVTWSGCCRGETPKSRQHNENSIELMAVAFRAEAMEFLAHHCCQSIIDCRWYGGVKLSPAKTAMCYIFPCLIYVEDNSRRRRGPVSGPEQSIRNETSKIISINTAESLQQNETEDSSYLAHPTNEVNISDDLLDESYSRANNLIDEPDNIPGTSVIYSNEDEQGKQRMRNKNIAPVGKMEALGVIFPIRHSKVKKESYELARIASNEKEPLKGEDLLEKEDLHKGLGYETKKKRTWRRLLLRMFGHYKTTGAKFIIHLLLRAIYVCLYAWVLVAKPRRTYSIPYPAAYWAEILVASVQMTQLCEFAIKVRHQMAPPDLRNEPSISTIQRRYKGIIKRLNRSFQDWAREHRVSLWRNGVIIANAILAIGIIVHASLHDGEIYGFWAFLTTMSDILFHVSFLFATISMIRFLSMFYFFGVLTYMLRRMVSVVKKFLLIFIVFWVIFAVCHISMAEEYGQRTNNSLPWLVFQNGAFEIFGEVDDEDKTGSVTGCDEFSWREFSKLNTVEMRCLFRSTLIPLTLFTYMILASIMLVNLLTALLTREYEEVSGGCSETYWKFEKYYLLAAYESKLWLPPPLSLFYYFLKLISVVIRLFTFFLCICCVCSCKSTVEAKQCGYVPDFLTTTFKIIEGKPWGTLKQCLDHDNDEENLKKIRQLIPKENKYQFSSKLKEMLAQLGQEADGGPEKRMDSANELMQKIFQMYTDYIRQETSTIITRVETAASRLSDLTQDLPINRTNKDARNNSILEDHGILLRN